MSIQKLPRSVSATIVSTSSIQSQVSVLKELIENAIDAITEEDTLNRMNNKESKASAQIYIEIDKESYGLDFLSVKDTGTGVPKRDRNLMCLNCTTSKLKSVDELSNGVATCGFRGEALNFIARLSTTLSISTKTRDDLMVDTWSVNNSGLQQSNSKSSPGVNGTTVRVTGLFKSTPVRYKFLKEKRLKMMKEIEDLIVTFALIYRDIRFQLKYVKLAPNGIICNSESKTYSTKENRVQFLSEILDIKDKNWIFQSNFSFEVSGIAHDSFNIKVSSLLPKMQLQYSTKHGMKVLIVNNRPMNLQLSFGKSILKKVNEAYSRNVLLVPPVWYIALEIPLDKVDFNIEPEKSDVIVSNEEKVLQLFNDNLFNVVKEEHYPDRITGNDKSIDPGDDALHTQVTESSNINEIPTPFSIDHSDDESFIEQLDSTLNNIQKRCNISYLDTEDMSTQNNKETGHDPPFKSVRTETSAIMESQKENRNSEIDQIITKTSNTCPAKTLLNDMDNDNIANDTAPDEPTANNTIPDNFLPTFEADNCHGKNADRDDLDSDHDWSRTVYDTTNISSEMGIIKQQIIEPREPKNVSPNHISLSNPSNIATSSKETKESATDNDMTLVDPNPKPSVEHTLSMSSGLVNKKQKINPKKTTKQMALSSFATYHIPEPSKNTKQTNKQKDEMKLPKILESSQNTIKDKLDVFFEYTLEKLFRNDQIIADEEWVNRSGIPSNQIITGALELYNKVPHQVEMENSVLNDEGIYQLE